MVNDIQNNTHFYDLRKKLRVKGYEHIVEYSNRQHIEKINHIFNTSEHENDADQTDIQDKILLIIKTAVEMRSSDIHIQIGSFTQVYFRIDGSRNVMQQFENTVENGQRLVQTLFNSMCTERSSSTFSYNEPCDAKIREEYVQAYGLSTGRFASRPGSSGKVIVVIRLISRRKQSLTLGELGLSEAQQNAIKRSLAKPAGVILSSGPTGHGKSTLSQCMAEIYTSENPGMNMLSVEDPIESPIEGTFQTPLIIADRSDSSKMGRAWGKSMSNLMRLDPDCIYIGEVRDNTSGNGVIEAAQTGHIVVTTIHTNHPIDIIQRLRRWGVDQDLLTDATLITCLIGLRLVKKTLSDLQVKLC
ncbi:ATPase, T2SS/T4P/T4SS family [Photorhabdus temperata]|uniref:ATPase, T2SS/T4P/T4SS family n=1 Tax=Photorhabdus temperata TaxID=574560 RepID=UPI0003F8FAE5|nr:ATPase, T2SS/T4P/T4SS family [Photorhabdus temperata]